MIRLLTLLTFVATAPASGPTVAEDDELLSLWAEIEHLGGEVIETESGTISLGALDPLLEPFLGTDDSTSLEGLGDEALTLDECWSPSFYEDRGPKRETGVRLVAEYTFEF